MRPARLENGGASVTVEIIKPAVRLPRREKGCDHGAERILIAINAANGLRAFWVKGSTAWASRGEQVYYPGTLIAETIESNIYGRPGKLDKRLLEGGRLTSCRLGQIQNDVADLLEAPELKKVRGDQQYSWPLSSAHTIVLNAKNDAVKRLREAAEEQQNERKQCAADRLARKEAEKTERAKPKHARIRVVEFQLECPYCNDGRLVLSDGTRSFNEAAGPCDVETLQCEDCCKEARVPHQEIEKLW